MRRVRRQVDKSPSFRDILEHDAFVASIKAVGVVRRWQNRESTNLRETQLPTNDRQIHTEENALCDRQYLGLPVITHS